MTELKDKRMEAASDIEHAGSRYFRTRAERFDQIFTTALRVTGADELAEALESIIDEFGCSIDQYNRIGPDYTHKDGTQVFNVSVLLDREPLLEKAKAALDRYRSLKGE